MAHRGLEVTVFVDLCVGCGVEPSDFGVNVDLFRGRGVNFQIGDQAEGVLMDTKKIPNYVVADGCHLPFKDKSFVCVVSSHTIEHTRDPEGFLSEMCRVASRFVKVVYPHSRGSGASRPYHLSFINEGRINDFVRKRGIADYVRHEVVNWDYPVSNRLRVPKAFKSTLAWRVLRHLERRLLNRRVKIPFDMASFFVIRGD